jgi:hypothetical protein
MNAADAQVALVQLRRAVAAAAGSTSDPGEVRELT